MRSFSVGERGDPTVAEIEAFARRVQRRLHPCEDPLALGKVGRERDQVDLWLAAAVVAPDAEVELDRLGRAVVAVGDGDDVGLNVHQRRHDGRQAAAVRERMSSLPIPSARGRSGIVKRTQTALRTRSARVSVG